MGRLKKIGYNKIDRRARPEMFNGQGVIGDGGGESFETQDMKKRRNEFMNYCLKKIHSAIHDQPMEQKDEQKSPLNVQKKATR